jgi:hypothetical protein
VSLCALRMSFNRSGCPPKARCANLSDVVGHPLGVERLSVRRVVMEPTERSTWTKITFQASYYVRVTLVQN